ncbi:YsnF/AvaK domain-containing protein [Telluribacter humicola]|uniref:YsnF/AvaK domain-containing protein n=1 Tax=Telluribacter humicola TaxID=1720261 RepID=UPI001A96F0CC|nr:YsnF/AvaK domain-containing protein [Telluribacter humicola]
MRQTIVGMFDSSEEARNAENKLVERGFDRSRIDISDRHEGYDTQHTSTDRDNDHKEDSIGHFFRSLFGDTYDDNADKLTHVARKSGCIVTVHADSREEAERAADILDDAGAIDIDDRAAQYGYAGTTGTTTHREGYTNMEIDPATGTTGRVNNDLTTGRGTDRDSASMKVVEENLQVGKRTVQTGGVRLRSRIIERPVEEHLRLRKEHVTVNRTPVNRAATDAELGTFKEGEVSMTERAEVPVVAKEARVVEEVSLNKEVEVRDETIRDTVRKQEVDVEQLRNDSDDHLTNDNTLNRDNRKN